MEQAAMELDLTALLTPDSESPPERPSMADVHLQDMLTFQAGGLAADMTVRTGTTGNTSVGASSAALGRHIARINSATSPPPPRGRRSTSPSVSTRAATPRTNSISRGQSMAQLGQ
jgi:hypothetical protein